MSKKRKTPKQILAQQEKNSVTYKEQIQELYEIAAKRIGGAVNIKGIGFQLLYSTFAIIKKLTTEDNVTIRLEGIEDIDLHLASSNEYIQIKTSVNDIDANKFWNLGLLQNFYVVYKVNSLSHFRIVHNSDIAKGMLDFLKSERASNDELEYWHNKFTNSEIYISKEELSAFLQKITIERITQDEIYISIVKILYQRYNINHGAELNYIRGLFYHIFDWAQKRHSISVKDLLTLIQTITDSFSKFPINLAIQNEWISPVSYELEESHNQFDKGYYDGKAARPIDIALGLNARRPFWESEIEKSIESFYVTVIKSSSGQGKSTVAFQVAKTMSEKDKRIYKINYCATYNEAIQIYEFIETRIKIGESPVIIIDGLNQSLSAWNTVAEKLRTLLVKIVVTAREEDWKRYMGDLNFISVNEVNISLSEHEAKEIFKGLKQNGRVDHSVLNWQPQWERVKDKGLLIEYVFLLTQGQMIYERLNAQVKKINLDVDASAKLEILRLVSLADVLNIRLRTKNIIGYIQQNIKFNTDRNEVFKQLEKEYYINFDKSYIEGLHPVRSRHLVDILNTNLEIETSLLTLLEIIDDDYVYDYFMNVFIYFPSIDQQYFCEGSTQIISNWALTNMVYAIDGIMHSEPFRYWMENKLIFDEAYGRGGFMLFVTDAIPFADIHILDKLLESRSEEHSYNMEYLSALAKKLPKFSIENAIVFKFLTCLKKALDKGRVFENLEGIAFLYKWFKRVNIPFPNIMTLDESQLLKIIEEKEISESSEIFHFYHLVKPIEYAKFVEKNYLTIVSWIKRKINIASIYEENGNVHMNYLLDGIDAGKANEFSVYRINIVHAFLPHYQEYCTKAIVLPFPNEQLYRVVVQNSTKHIPIKNLFDDFDVHLNQIWLKTIENQYSASSIYDWQKQYFSIRTSFIELTRVCIRLFESHLERNSARVKSATNNFIVLADDFLRNELILKKYPSPSQKYFDRDKFEEEQNSISKFYSSYRNFLNQLSGIFSNKDFHLPVINLNTASDSLIKFQHSFQAIVDNSYSYFNFSEIVKDEIMAMSRLKKTVRFYKHYVSTDLIKIVVARNDVEIWWEEDLMSQLNQLGIILKKMHQRTGFTFQLPNRIMEEENLKYAIIGVEGCDLSSSDELMNLSIAGMLLMETDISFFTFVFITEKKANFAFRMSREYFQKFIDLAKGEEIKADDLLGHPIPLTPDKDMLELLGGISLNSIQAKKEDEDLYKMLVNVWKLNEYRERLNVDNIVQKNWLQEIEREYSANINTILETTNKMDEFNEGVANKALRFLNHEIKLNTDEIVDLMLQRAYISANIL